MFDTPILLIVFNRPDCTREVMEKIAAVQPRTLYVAADAPRPDRPGDVEKCQKTRDAILGHIDWDCEVNTLFHKQNLGCGLGGRTAPPAAITWFFQHVERGIILEDDCVPDLTFFRFAEELLAHYRDNDRIMHINGSNFLQGHLRGTASYYFSRYTHVWGWATWRRAWNHFQADRWDDCVWDSVWWRSVLDRNGLAITPNTNLVTNIGCAIPDATHTTAQAAHYARVPLQPMNYPLSHPSEVSWQDRFGDYSVLLHNDISFTNLLFGVPRNLLKFYWPQWYRVFK